MLDPKDISASAGQGRLVPVADYQRCLDTQQLHDLEQAFRRWALASKRPDHKGSRDRILLIFLLIRYTGARLNEVLTLDFVKDFDLHKNIVRFGKKQNDKECNVREVQLPEVIADDIKAMIVAAQSWASGASMFRIDPAHVRRKFYQQAVAIGIESGLGSPESIRKSRAVELIRSNMPLPVVQKILGHRTPNLAASYVAFSESEIRHVAQFFAERENNRKTSARNAFFGKINTLKKGEIQAVVEVVSLGGHNITSIITSDSLARIGLQPGMLVTAEVKAPSIHLCKSRNRPLCSAENVFQGTVARMRPGNTTAEIVVQLQDGTELCAIISERSRQQMDIKEGALLWAFFDGFAVVLHVD